MSQLQPIDLAYYQSWYFWISTLILIVGLGLWLKPKKKWKRDDIGGGQ
jgi:hypothetical protein